MQIQKIYNSTNIYVYINNALYNINTGSFIYNNSCYTCFFFVSHIGNITHAGEYTKIYAYYTEDVSFTFDPNYSYNNRGGGGVDAFVFRYTSPLRF